MIKLYNTYNKAKEWFVKPRLNVKFGLWSNDNCLPVWRGGPIIYLCKKSRIAYSYYNSMLKNNGSWSAYQVGNCVNIKTGTTKEKLGDKEYDLDHYTQSKHTLPGNLIPYKSYVWNSNIRRKLRKWHLSWIKPVVKLPSVFAFHIFNHDIIWKTKWTKDDIRFEYPSQFTIVFFGLSLSFWLSAPKSEDPNTTFEDAYWETMLKWIYNYKDKTLEDFKSLLKNDSIWETIAKSTATKHICISRDMIQEKYRKYWDEVNDSIERNNE